MAGKSDYLENAVLNHVIGGPNYARPGVVYLALYTVPPTDAGGGTEVSGAGYARAAVTNNAVNFPAAVAGVKQLAVAQSFPESAGDWGTVVAMGIFDADPAGNLLYWSLLISSVLIPAGSTATFLSNKLTLTED